MPVPFLQAEDQRLEIPYSLLSGKVAADICDKHLSGVPPRISFVRSKPQFVLIHNSDVKNCQVTLSQADISLHKMIASDQVFTAIEKTLTKTPALYRYAEFISKSYLIP